MALPAPIPGSVFMQTEIPAPTQLLRGIVDQGGKLAIGGGSKSHKSWVFADLALAISTGTPWLAFDTGPAQPVLYMNFEIPAFHFQRRLEAISKARKIEVPDELVVWNLRGYAASYSTIEEDLIKVATANKAAMVITDPLYKIMGDTDENSAGDMAKLFNSLERVSSKTNAAAAYAGHFSKGNQSQKSAIDRVSGSGVHGRDPDAIINFTPHKVTEAYTVDLILRCYAPVNPFVVRWAYPVMEIADDLDPATLKEAGGRVQRFSVLEMTAILRSRGRIDSTTEFIKLAKGDYTMSETTCRRLLKELKQKPEVVVTDDAWTWVQPASKASL